jgi:RNA polymerase sigma-70 factor (ECF subfamily)
MRRMIVASLRVMASDRDFEAVLVAARNGQGWALAELYRALYPHIVRYLRAVEPSEAEDLASDTWLDIVLALERFHGDESGLRAFSFTIARRRLLDVRRRRSRRRTEPCDPRVLIQAGPTGDVEEEALSSLGTDWAINLITSSLTSEQADVVLLRVVGDLDVEAVARIVGKRPGAIRVLHHRALRRLAKILQREGVTR